MKKYSNKTELSEERKKELLRKIEEDYLNYLRSSLRGKDLPLSTPGNQNSKKERVYQIEDTPDKPQKREDLINYILNLRENPLAKFSDKSSASGKSPSTHQGIINTPRETFNSKLKKANNELQRDYVIEDEEELFQELEADETQKEPIKIQLTQHMPLTQNLAREQETEPTSLTRQQPAELKPETKPTAQKKQTYDEGTILRFEDGTIGIYISQVPGKEYEIIYCLNGNGSVEPRGITLYSMKHTVLGKLPEERVQHIKSKMRWMREEIIYYLDKFEYIHLIPQINHRESPGNTLVEEKVLLRTDSSVSTKENKTGEKEKEIEIQRSDTQAPALIRGRKIRINYGNRFWEAVYWGADQYGPIVAHKTSGKWELMHLDFSRFADKIEYGEIISSHEMAEIQDAFSG
ncbi:MAG: hypothetical protein N2246_03700 [Candidatus Sumerlaeia bacterium]|nr:hypothetical protein [Candidatus Sumerlaeia bacterium]